MSNRWEEELREHLRREARTVSELPRPLAARIAGEIRAGARRPILAQLALAGVLLILVALVGVLLAQLRATRHPVTPPPAPPPGASSCTDRSGGTPGLAAQLKEIRYSGIAVEFEFETLSDGPPGLPAYQLTRQESAQFVGEPGTQPLSLAGSHGLKVTLPDIQKAPPRWIKISSVVPGDQSSLVQGVGLLGTPRQGLSAGIGLAAPACFRVRDLPNILVISFEWAGTGSPSPSSGSSLYRPYEIFDLA